MKVCIVLLLCFIGACIADVNINNPLNAPDLPGFTPNLQLIPAGSLVIPMDPSLQILDPGTGLMSVLPYGVAIRTLHANISISWAINTGKQMSGADFSTQTAISTFDKLAVAGTAAASSSNAAWTSTTTRTYYGGPFVILQKNVQKALNAWSTWRSNPSAYYLTVDQNVYRGVTVHILLQDTLIDIRHTINSHPFIAVSNLDGNSPTQTAMLGCLYANPNRLCPREDGYGWGGIFGNGAAGCQQFKPQDHAGLDFKTHYDSYDCGTQVAALTTTTCLTTFSEPHWAWDASTGPSYISAMKSFIFSGANFFAQCASIQSYEDQAGTGAGRTGTFLTEYGLQTIYTNDGIVGPTITNYPDLPITQYVGEMSSYPPGQVPDFYNLFGTTNDAPPQGWTVNNGPSNAGYNNFKAGVAFPLVTNRIDASGSPYRGRNIYVAAGVRYNPNLVLGSNIWYLGGHTWAGQSVAGTENGRRYFFNAYIIPANRPTACGFTFCTAGDVCQAPNVCQSCVCSPLGDAFITSQIAGCCLSNTDCTGSCQQCNLNSHTCELAPGCCSSSVNCTTLCTTCSSTTSAAGTCIAQAGCCTTKADCGANPCAICKDNACEVLPEPCCDVSVKTACSSNPCQVCDAASNQCTRQQPLTNCCLANADCGGNPCQACNPTTRQCYKIPGCCDSNADCGTSPCINCTANACLRIPECCETNATCGACRQCDSNDHICVASSDPNCCTSDEQCGTCRRCAPGAGTAKTCVAISQCCITDSDCESCQNCSNSQCSAIAGCCNFDSDCVGCDICEQFNCVTNYDLSCCQSDNDCELAREVLRNSPNATDVPECDLICNIQGIGSNNNTGVCQQVCSSPKDYTGLIVGLAAGVPLGLLCLAAIAAALIAFLLWKRDALTGALLSKGAGPGLNAQTSPVHVAATQTHTTGF